MESPIIRPVQLKDLEALIGFAEDAGYGITSLPRNRDVLAARLQESIHAFHGKTIQSKRETYLFMMDWKKKAIGITGIVSRVGSQEPFYAYHLKTSDQKSETLGIKQSIDVLHFVHARKKPTEIGTLFLEREYRHRHWGRLLSFSRFLFITAFREHFAPFVIAELRGISDTEGNSPFWDAVGRKFFHCTFKMADQLRTEHPQCIEELFPTQPIYTVLLPKYAQNAIGQFHPDTTGAAKLLEKQGFVKSEYVDIFDGGPHVYARTDQIHAIKNSRLTKLKKLDTQVQGKVAIVTNDRLDFRATLADVKEEESGIVIAKEIAEALEVDTGMMVRYYILGEH